MDSAAQNQDDAAAGRSTVSERAVKDTAKQFAAQILVGLCAVFFAAWLNRLLPAEQLALWPICVNLGSVVASLGSFGLGDTFVRLVPAQLARGQADEAARLLRTGLLLNLLACIVLSAAIYLLADPVARLLLHDPSQTNLVRTMALAAFFIAFAERLNWGLQAVQEFGKRALINAITGVLRTPLALALYLLLHGPLGVVVALTITPLIGCVLSTVWMWRHLRWRSGFSPIGKTLAASIPFYGVSLVSIISYRMNPLVIALFVPREVLATYFVASSIVGYVASLDRFAIDSVLPKLSEKGATAKGVAETEEVFHKCTRYLFLGLVPLYLLIAAVATPLMELYGGPQYADSGLILAVLSIGLLFGAVYDLQRAHMVVFSRPVHVFNLQVAHSVSNVLGLVLFVPFLGALGAALNDFVRTVVGLIVSSRILQRSLRMRFDYHALASTLLATGAALGLVWLLQPWWGQRAVLVLPVLVLAVTVYLLALARRLSAADVNLIMRCLPLRACHTGAGARSWFGRLLSWIWTEPTPKTRPAITPDHVEGQ